jgi:hypothetical protein
MFTLQGEHSPHRDMSSVSAMSPLGVEKKDEG